VDEKYLEQASRQEEKQREAAMRNVQARLEGDGQSDCKDCGEPIPCDRREAVPGANRCIKCQSTFECLKGWGT
jgi:phage/conjugal plasmid C-4 type zinc finger TraR family protein